VVTGQSWRLCRRVLQFHRFDALGPEPVLVGEHTFEYEERPEGCRLVAVGYTAHRGDAATKALPALRFTYSRPRPPARSSRPRSRRLRTSHTGSTTPDTGWSTCTAKGWRAS
jgi:hypothetical protein